MADSGRRQASEWTVQEKATGSMRTRKVIAEHTERIISIVSSSAPFALTADRRRLDLASTVSRRTARPVPDIAANTLARDATTSGRGILTRCASRHRRRERSGIGNATRWSWPAEEHVAYDRAPLHREGRFNSSRGVPRPRSAATSHRDSLHRSSSWDMLRTVRVTKPVRTRNHEAMCEE